MKRILFVCYGNACRSQMAEAFARSMAQGPVEIESAGLAPLGEVPQEVHAAMNEAGISLQGQFSKPIALERLEEFDAIVNMSGVPWPFGCHDRLLEWDVLDPYGCRFDTYRRSRDQIREMVQVLLGDLARVAQKPAGGARVRL